jgi:hypothetical protein
MKQTITALLLALTLVLGLTGCTTKKNNGSNSSTVPGNNTTQNGTNNGNTNNGTQNGGTNIPNNNTQNNTDNQNGTANNGTYNNDDAYNNGSNTNPANGSRSYNGYDSYALPGSNGGTTSDSYNDLMRGRSYEEMLRNGRIRDTDGILTDGENYTSQW